MAAVPDSEYESIHGLLDEASNRHAMTILRQLEVEGAQRYSEIEAVLDVASTSTLSKRLTGLAEVGLITRKNYKEIPPRVEYRLTPLGEAFLEHIAAWEDIEQTHR